MAVDNTKKRKNKLTNYHSLLIRTRLSKIFVCNRPKRKHKKKNYVCVCVWMCMYICMYMHVHLFSFLGFPSGQMRTKILPVLFRNKLPQSLFPPAPLNYVQTFCYNFIPLIRSLKCLYWKGDNLKVIWGHSFSQMRICTKNFLK